jgi:hypothetical protein
MAQTLLAPPAYLAQPTVQMPRDMRRQLPLTMLRRTLTVRHAQEGGTAAQEAEEDDEE